MQGEHIDYGYTGTTAVPREVKAMKSTLVKLFGISFSARQFGLTVLALALAFIVFKAVSALGLGSIAPAVALLPAAPLFVLAFVRVHGLDYGDWLMVKRANTKYSTPVRKNDCLNAFEKLEDLCDRATKTKKRKPARRGNTASGHMAFR